jgi:hypothetical protein
MKEWKIFGWWWWPASSVFFIINRQQWKVTRLTVVNSDYKNGYYSVFVDDVTTVDDVTKAKHILIQHQRKVIYALDEEDFQRINIQ